MLIISVHGEATTVKLTPDGIFYVEGRKENATTLKGLEKKLNSVPGLNPNAPPIRVEHKTSLKQGKVTGRDNNRSHYSFRYRIKWDDGTRSVLSESSLRRPMTEEQRQQLEAAEQEASNAEDAYMAANDAHEALVVMHDVSHELRERFPNA